MQWLRGGKRVAMRLLWDSYKVANWTWRDKKVPMRTLCGTQAVQSTHAVPKHSMKKNTAIVYNFHRTILYSSIIFHFKIVYLMCVCVLVCVFKCLVYSSQFKRLYGLLSIPLFFFGFIFIIILICVAIL